VVHKGQLLARLDPTFSVSDKVAMGEQAASLRAEVERLEAERAGVDYRPSISNQAALVQETIFAQRRAERMSQHENFRQKIDGLKAQLLKAAGDVQAYNDRARVAGTVLNKRNELQHLGWGSQLNTLTAQDQQLEMQRNLEDSRNQVKSAAGDLASMQAQAAADEQDWQSKISMDLTDAQRKLADMSGSLEKAQLRSQLVDLRADIDATVLTRAQVSVGSVLQSGDQFFTLVPLGSPLEVEATVSGDDAGFVHPGDPVNIKFATFPFIRYGSAKGTVRTISPDSFVSDPDGPVQRPTLDSSAKPVAPGASFYRAWITLTNVGLHDTPPGFKITPGMPVSADVMVGKRTVLTYIFNRALPVAMDGMREP
jgi:hemolysin D